MNLYGKYKIKKDGTDISNFGSTSAGQTARNIGVNEQLRRAEEERQEREKEKDKNGRSDSQGGIYGRYGESKKYDW